MPTNVLTPSDPLGPDKAQPALTDARLPHDALEPPRLIDMDAADPTSRPKA